MEADGFFSRWRGFAVRFGRARRASTALEFAIIGSAFFLILCGLFTLSLDMYLQFTMDTAVRAAAREVQIGEVTTGAQFVAAVCGELGLVAAHCTNSLQYSVQSGTYYGAGGDSGSIIGTAGGLTALGLSAPANFSSITKTADGEPQFLLIQAAMPVPFSFYHGLDPVVTQNGTRYLYSAVATVVEP